MADGSMNLTVQRGDKSKAEGYTPARAGEPHLELSHVLFSAMRSHSLARANRRRRVRRPALGAAGASVRSRTPIVGSSELRLRGRWLGRRQHGLENRRRKGRDLGCGSRWRD